MPAIPLPTRRAKDAPKLNDIPRGVVRYMEDVEYVLSQARITDDAAKKAAAVRYLSIDDEDMWKSLPEYDDSQASFGAFKEAVFAMYPGCKGEQRYRLSDLAQCVSETQKGGIASLQEYGEYLRSFSTISGFLRKRGQLDRGDLISRFTQPFSASLRNQIYTQLQIKLPDHDSSDPFTLAEVDAAARVVLARQEFLLAAESSQDSDIMKSVDATVKTEPREQLPELIRHQVAAFLAQNLQGLIDNYEN